jgi:hypothetical protein
VSIGVVMHAWGIGRNSFAGPRRRQGSTQTVTSHLAAFATFAAASSAPASVITERTHELMTVAA